MKSRTSTDGFRVLVDRLWPRGKKKADLRLDLWAKDISPSTELRKWFGHDPTRWLEFCKRYKAELAAPEMKNAIAEVVNAAHKHSTMTLIYGAKDTEHNEAVVLLPFLQASSRTRGERIIASTRNFSMPIPGSNDDGTMIADLAHFDLLSEIAECRTAEALGLGYPCSDAL